MVSEPLLTMLLVGELDAVSPPEALEQPQRVMVVSMIRSQFLQMALLGIVVIIRAGGDFPNDPYNLMVTGFQVSFDSVQSAVMEIRERSVKITVRDLDFYYGKIKALSSISMVVHQHEITALIGPSGCGKSTFLRCLNRMNDTIPGTRLEGEVLIDGMDIYKSELDPVDLRQKVGMVFQKPNPFPQSVYDNVAFGPRIMGLAGGRMDEEIRVEASLRQAALWDDVKDNLNENALGLSLGEQQRLCIARALAVEPEIVLMDEPTSALDPIATLEIENLMTDLKDDYTIVVVTHNMQQAARVSDVTGLFWLGELVEFGKTDQIFTRPKQERTEAYVTGRVG
jgi:phosphate transport system ATP-binding protein